MEHHYSHDAIPYAMSHAPSNAEHHATANAPRSLHVMSSFDSHPDEPTTPHTFSLYQGLYVPTMKELPPNRLNPNNLFASASETTAPLPLTPLCAPDDTSARTLPSRSRGRGRREAPSSGITKRRGTTRRRNSKQRATPLSPVTPVTGLMPEPSTVAPKMPMPLPPPDFHFQLSPGLQRTLSSSPSARGRARSRAEVDNIVNMVYEECDAFAEQQKVHVRNDMKKQLLELNGLCPQLKQTYRSRREARVSRVKSDEFQKAIKNVVRHLIACMSASAHYEYCATGAAYGGDGAAILPSHDLRYHDGDL